MPATKGYNHKWFGIIAEKYPITDYYAMSAKSFKHALIQCRGLEGVGFKITKISWHSWPNNKVIGETNDGLGILC